MGNDLDGVRGGALGLKRGEIWWADIPAPVGRRPVLLLSRNAAYATRDQVTVATVTRRIRDIPVEVPLDLTDGMPKPCIVNLDNVTTIPKAALTEWITTLTAEKMEAVEEALRFALDLRP